ncbi:MAG: 23S rRNA (uracil(1939)-C(5))-methyltransferase RlmD [Phascolarctobacterium sp.]|nr:23S rRNA (uracil(1939)-C(5))-methyltransferase RlmD [Phascolarctobacterium sp.]
MKHDLPVSKGQTIELEITGLNSEGDGVGRFEGLTIFVKGALSGEKVLANLTVVKKNYAVGKLKKILVESPDRVKPLCPVYKECGGCQLQHLSYEGQLKAKRQQVWDALTRIGHLTGVNVLPTLEAPNPWNYRNKMQVPCMGTPQKQFIGCFALNTHKVIDVENCFIQKEKNNAIVKVVREWMKKYKIAPYDEDKGTGIVRHIMGRVGAKTGELMVCLVTATDNVPHFKDLTKMLKEALPELKSVVQNVNKRHTNVILGNKTQVIYGKENISDSIGNLKFNISCQSFFQVNSEQAERLYAKALEYAALTGKEIVADVYCGTGTISLFLAQKAKHVFGIEIVAPAIRDAKANARNNNINNATFILGDAAQKMPELVEDGVKLDVVVVDPPRAGCEPRVLDAIAKVKPKRVVYVSCNPATLARDLAYMTQKGYKVDKVQPCDMFPMSFHVECVCMLSKLSAAKKHVDVG